MNLARQRLGMSTIKADRTPWYLKGGIAKPNCIAAYQPMGAPNLAASYINLAHPGTNNATPGVAPDFSTPNGWFFDGTTQYLTTGVVPNGGGWSAIIRFSDFSGSQNALFGCMSNSTTQFDIWANSGSKVAYHNSALLTVAPNITSGILAVAGTVGYRNGIADTGNTGAWSGTGTRDIYLGIKNTGTLNVFALYRLQAFAVYNIILTAPQVLAITNAMNSISIYQTGPSNITYSSSIGI